VGGAGHHGVPRTRGMRKGDIRILCATTTLAVGMNLPMKNALIDPKKWRFDKKTRSLVRVSMPVSDFENNGGGRVGRFGFIEDFGRAVFVPQSYVEEQYPTLPKAVKESLVTLLFEMEVAGPVRGNWPNYGKLGKGRHHCHIKKGHPTYVAERKPPFRKGGQGGLG